jgi:hypothetical protein
MNENKTVSILQRLPVILAVTAASYRLTLSAAARNSQVNAPQKGWQSRVVPRP